MQYRVYNDSVSVVKSSTKSQNYGLSNEKWDREGITYHELK